MRLLRILSRKAVGTDLQRGPLHHGTDVINPRSGQGVASDGEAEARHRMTSGIENRRGHPYGTRRHLSVGDGIAGFPHLLEALVDILDRLSEADRTQIDKV